MGNLLFNKHECKLKEITNIENFCKYKAENLCEDNFDVECRIHQPLYVNRHVLFTTGVVKLRCPICDDTKTSETMELAISESYAVSLTNVTHKYIRYKQFINFNVTVSPQRKAQRLWIKVKAVVIVYIHWLKFIKRYYTPTSGDGYKMAKFRFYDAVPTPVYYFEIVVDDQT